MCREIAAASDPLEGGLLILQKKIHGNIQLMGRHTSVYVDLDDLIDAVDPRGRIATATLSSGEPEDGDHITVCYRYPGGTRSLYTPRKAVHEKYDTFLCGEPWTIFLD